MSAPSLDEAAFRGALGSWASGVSVVTTSDGGMLYGLTVSSFSSVSMAPPLILVCLNNDNRMGEMVASSGRFAVSLLGEDQVAASNYFATPGREPTEGFVEIEGEWTEHGVPIVKGSLAHVVCDHHSSHVAGSHVIVLGSVLEAVSVEDGRGPLVYWRRGYRTITTDGDGP